MAELTGRLGDAALLDDEPTRLAPLQTVVGTPGADRLIGTAAADTLNGRGGADTLFGRGGDDLIRGNGGRDRLFGQGGDDRLIGNNGPDRLSGGGGDDRLVGGNGLDTMIGGGGADTFVVTGRGPVDRIIGFRPAADDVVDLGPALQAFDPGADQLGDFVRFTRGPDGLTISVDPSGSGSFRAAALLVGSDLVTLLPSQLGLPEPGQSPGAGGLVSVNADGQPGNGVSFKPALSSDGSVLTFATSATDLAQSGNAVFDVLRLDLDTGTFTRISTSAGTGPGNADSLTSAVSGDGSTVAFESAATNLSAVDTGNRDVYVRDGAGPIDLASIIDNRAATDPSLSADGTRVAFEAVATGRAETGDPAAAATITNRIYVRDLETGELIEASTRAPENNGRFANETSANPDISALGNFVAFDSVATNLVPGDPSGLRDVFVKNINTGAIFAASTNADGIFGAGASAAPSLSGNGRLVAFQSTARFVAEDAGNAEDIYLKNIITGEIELVSTNADGVRGNGRSFTPSLSDDGRIVAFRSEASNLVEGDDNGIADIFVKNLATGEVLRFEVAGDSSGANIFDVEPVLSGDGSTVAFTTQIQTDANGNLIAGQVATADVRFAPAGAPPAPGGGGPLVLADILSGEEGAASGGGPGPASVVPATPVDPLLTPADGQTVL